MLLGNGTMGAMVWGAGRVLRLTVARADFWDRRGGVEWNADMSYAKIRDNLERGDETALSEFFVKPKVKDGQPNSPSVLPVGRFEFDFGAGVTLVCGWLDIARGAIDIELSRDGAPEHVFLILDMHRPLLAVKLPSSLPKPRVRGIPAWKFVSERLKSISFDPPTRIRASGISGWVQTRPSDEALCVACGGTLDQMFVTAVYGADARTAATMARQGLEEAEAAGFGAVKRRAAKWWKAYWHNVPQIRIPNERLAFLYNYGMYKFGSLTNPSGVAATLQGPWVEEYQMPPWSGDYHFNINVQMCYWPAYHGNCLEHLRPLFDLVLSWRGKLARNARMFLGIDDGFMLPHAVSDKGVCIGGSWAESLDHGCTAWIAAMMYRYCRYTMDLDFLREKAYPFMVGTMRVYEEMLERRGGKLTLPVSVSPEYKSLSGRQWGRDASFQLACIHRLCEDLLEASETLGLSPSPVWHEIHHDLPKACLIEDVGGRRIAIWEGVDLEESHRHHSHLAGIVPFDVFAPDDPDWADVIVKSMDRWVLRGPAKWSGWSMPWAAMLQTRFDRGASAEMLLEIWQRVFTNEGHGTLHDPSIPGYTLVFGGSYGSRRTPEELASCEVMQIEAGIAAASAVQEMLLHTRRGVNHVFSGTPAQWRDASFGPMRTDGAFLVSAERKCGRTQWVRVESPCGGVFRLANPWEKAAVVRQDAAHKEILVGATLEIETAPGEVLEISEHGHGRPAGDIRSSASARRP